MLILKQNCLNLIMTLVNLNSALIHFSLTWYQCVSYITEDHYGNIEKVCLRLGDMGPLQ